ncbi:MAG: Lysophospholipid transporter LplT [Sodalis sp.]|nr:MAG: Lysophospholipid transporter LplT [Sodalis sp.]
MGQSASDQYKYSANGEGIAQVLDQTVAARPVVAVLQQPGDAPTDIAGFCLPSRNGRRVSRASSVPMPCSVSGASVVGRRLGHHRLYAICAALAGQTRLAIIDTSLFWGAGVTLYFLLVLLVPVALGIVFGIAARFIRLETVRRCMPAGIVLGGAVVILAYNHHLLPACGVLAVISMLSGFFIVPLNALLQHREQQSVGAGNTIAVHIAVQNFAKILR